MQPPQKCFNKQLQSLLKQMKKKKKLSKEIQVIIKEPNGNYRTEKYNNRNLKINLLNRLNSIVDMIEE